MWLGNCGATLIAPDIVLTAAHCLDKTNSEVQIGAYRRLRSDEGAQSRFCDRWIADPKFNGRTSGGYDFALCKLNEPVEIDESRVRLVVNDKSNIPSSGEDLLIVGLGMIWAAEGLVLTGFASGLWFMRMFVVLDLLSKFGPAHLITKP